MNRLLIKGGRVIDPASGIDGLFDVYVIGGKIAAVKPAPPPNTPISPFEKGGIKGGLEKGGRGDLNDWTIMDAAGLLVCPGFIDMHTHLREPTY